MTKAMERDSKLEDEFKKSVHLMTAYYLAVNVGDMGKMMQTQPQEAKEEIYDKIKREARIAGLLGMVAMAMEGKR